MFMKKIFIALLAFCLSAPAWADEATSVALGPDPNLAMPNSSYSATEAQAQNLEQQMPDFKLLIQKTRSQAGEFRKTGNSRAPSQEEQFEEIPDGSLSPRAPASQIPNAADTERIVSCQALVIADYQSALQQVANCEQRIGLTDSEESTEAQFAACQNPSLTEENLKTALSECDHPSAL